MTELRQIFNWSNRRMKRRRDIDGGEADINVNATILIDDEEIDVTSTRTTTIPFEFHSSKSTHVCILIFQCPREDKESSRSVYSGGGWLL